MAVLNQLPFVKLVIPTVLGISLAILIPRFGFYSSPLLILFLFLFGFFTIKRFKISFVLFSNLSIYLVFISLGGLLTHYANPKNQHYNLEKAGLTGVYLIQIDGIPQVKLNTTKIQARVIGRIADHKIIRANEMALIYIDKEIKISNPGDELIVKCDFKPIPEPENPYQFNYKRFLKWQGIYYQSFIRKQEFIKNTNLNSASVFQKLSFNGSKYLKKLFKENIIDPKALAVTESLIFGYKDDIPKDLVDSYSRTGTLHVLAVSGLHVAIVFLMLAKFLWFLDKWRHGVWFKTLIVIFCIWGYCVLTGMAPSIIRAGAMISLVLIGKALNREANIFNTIAVSAFLILCLNPNWLLNVGFQLSFAAVLGIVYLQEYLMPLWTPPNWFFRQVWNILVISICAQIATFPLSLYYFNQFPNYFLLSNLLIIPLSSFVIYTGIGLVIFSKIPWLLFIFSWLTEQLVKLTNFLVTTIEKFPFSFVDGIKINVLQLILIYGCIGCMIFWLINSNKKGFIFSLISLLLIVIISCFDKLKLQKEKNIAFFNIPSQTAILVSDGNKSVLISDNQNTGKVMFYLRGWLINKRLWPLCKTYDFNVIEKQKVELPEMDLIINKGVLFFKGSTLNLSSNNLGSISFRQSYILPIFFDRERIYDDMIQETVIVGQSKSKRLQKKVKKCLSKYHNSVICEMQSMGFKLLKICE